MTPEDKLEFKALIREVLKESNEEVISPLVDITKVYKDVEIAEGSDKIVADSKLDEAETVKVTKTIKWSQIQDIEYTSKSDQHFFEIKQLYKLYLNTGPIYAHIKNIEEFTQSWEKATLTYGFI